MWKQILSLREFFRQEVSWKVGEGKNIRVLSEPWFDGWNTQREARRSDRLLTVEDVFDFETNQWKVEILERLFDAQTLATILNGATKPTQSGIRDKLIWNQTKTGKYSVKDGYTKLIQQGPTDSLSEIGELWGQISKWKEVTPKVKVFMWRLISKGLMLANNMHRRINSISPMCQRCNLENEYESHCFFFCPGSRAVWFEGNLGLRTHTMPINIKEAIAQCVMGLDEEQRKEFCYTMWEIWKARNRAVIRKEQFKPAEVKQRVRIWLQNIPVLARNQGEVSRERGDLHKYEYIKDGWQILIDGSWDTSNRAGHAHIFYADGKIWRIGYDNQEVGDAFHAEAVALKGALVHLSTIWGNKTPRQVIIYSDCQNLVDAVMEGGTYGLPSWRAAQDVRYILQVLAILPQQILLRHARREAIHQAHQLAVQARRENDKFQGTPRFWKRMEAELLETLDNRFYQRVQDDPP